MTDYNKKRIEDAPYDNTGSPHRSVAYQSYGDELWYPMTSERLKLASEGKMFYPQWDTDSASATYGQLKSKIEHEGESRTYEGESRTFDLFMKDLASYGVNVHDPEYDYKAFYEWVEKDNETPKPFASPSGFADVMPKVLREFRNSPGGLPTWFMDDYHPGRFELVDINETPAWKKKEELEVHNNKFDS